MFGDFFADLFTKMTPMTDLIVDLRGRGLRTYIFSNTNDLAVEHVRRIFPFFRDFDGYIFSYEVKAMKPEAHLEALEPMRGERGADILSIWMTVRKTWRPARNAAGGRSCTRRRKKRGRLWKILSCCVGRFEPAH